jgi:hypothetical protein
MVEFGRVAFTGFVDAFAGGRYAALESMKLGFMAGVTGMNGDIGDVIVEPELSEPELGTLRDAGEGGAGT